MHMHLVGVAYMHTLSSLCIILCIYTYILGYSQEDRLSVKNTQPTNKEATTEVTCIGNWHDLVNIFQKETKRAPPFPTVGFLSTLLLVHIHTDASNPSDVHNSSNYCQLSELDEPADNCTVVAVYSQTIFDVYPAALLVSSTLVVGYPSAVQRAQRHTISEITWTLPIPLCSGQFTMKDIVYYEVSERYSYYGVAV